MPRGPLSRVSLSSGPEIALAILVVAGLVLAGLFIVRQATDSPGSSASSADTAPASSVEVSDSSEPPTVAPPSPVAEQFPATGKYTGDVGSDQGAIPVAVTVDSGQAKVYVCDGHQIEAWLQGSAANGSVDAHGRNGNHMDAHLSGGHVVGSVHLSGHPDWRFDAPAASDQHAGIYRSSRSGRTSGWVVKDRKRQTGITRDASGLATPAPPLPLDGPLPDGVSMVDGATNLLP